MEQLGLIREDLQDIKQKLNEIDNRIYAIQVNQIQMHEQVMRELVLLQRLSGQQARQLTSLLNLQTIDPMKRFLDGQTDDQRGFVGIVEREWQTSPYSDALLGATRNLTRIGPGLDTRHVLPLIKRTNS